MMSLKLAVRVGIGALVLLLGVSTLASAARKDDPDAAGELYGDLYVIERDGNGEPILRDVTYFDPETAEDVTVWCQQPLGADCSLLPLWGENAEFDPELYDPCGVHDDSVGLTQEVSFGRGSVARSQDFVIDSAYSEVIKTINVAVQADFDPAGRIRLEIPLEGSETGETAWRTIDAPLENLGLYREVMSNGCLGTVTDEVIGEEGVPVLVTFALDESAVTLLCGGELSAGACLTGAPGADLLCEYPDFGVSDDWWMNPAAPDAAGVTHSVLLLATAFLAGATDKSNPLSLDEIINLNTYLGLNSYTFEKSKKDRILTVSYFDFGSYSYDRASTFPVGASWDLLEHACGAEDPHPAPHTFVSNAALPLFSDGVDLDAVNLPVCRAGSVLGLACDSPSISDCGGANYFAQAAEHARKTVWFIHNWEVPEIAY